MNQIANAHPLIGKFHTNDSNVDDSDDEEVCNCKCKYDIDNSDGEDFDPCSNFANSCP